MPIDWGGFCLCARKQSSRTILSHTTAFFSGFHSWVIFNCVDTKRTRRLHFADWDWNSIRFDFQAIFESGSTGCSSEVSEASIGAALIKEAHKRACQLNYETILVLGHKDYYPRFGYKKAENFGITFPFEVQPEFCMVKELTPGAASRAAGQVKYPKAFFEY